MTSQSRRKGVARCERCGRALAVWLVSDEVRPIGSVDGCPCGSSSFTVFD